MSWRATISARSVADEGLPGRGDPFLDLQKTIAKAVLLQSEAILGIQSASDLSQRIPMALAVRNVPGIWIYDVLKLNTPNPGYLILTPKISISTSKLQTLHNKTIRKPRILDDLRYTPARLAI